MHSSTFCSPVPQAKRRLESDVESMQMRIAGFIESDGRPRDMSEKAAAFSKVPCPDLPCPAAAVVVLQIKLWDAHDPRCTRLSQRKKRRRTT